MATINVALVGAGRVGTMHAGIIAKHPACRLDMVCDANLSVAEKLAASYSAQACSAEDAFADKNIDAVVIASSTATHVDFIKKAVGAGKAVFCEKPLDLDLEECFSCLRFVKEHGGLVMMGFNRRFDSNLRELKKALDAGDIGRAGLLTITSCDPEPPSIAFLKTSGGLFRDMMIHDFDTSCWLMDARPTHISAMGACLFDKAIAEEAKDIDVAVVSLQFADGRIAVLKASRRSAYGYDQRIEILGKKGMLCVANEVQNTVLKLDAAGVNSSHFKYFFLERYAQAFRTEWDAFACAVQNKTAPEVGVPDGVVASILSEAAYESLNTGKIIEIAYPSALD